MTVPPLRSPRSHFTRRIVLQRLAQFVLLGSVTAEAVRRSGEIGLGDRLQTVAGGGTRDALRQARSLFQGESLEAAVPISAADWQAVQTDFAAAVAAAVPEVEIPMPSFLGGAGRRFYGRGVPQGLRELHRIFLGSGTSRVGSQITTWSGAGWTGQPTIVRDRGKLYLIQGAFDYNLRKIDLSTHQEVWRYRFDDILKGTATIYVDPTAAPDNRVVVLQGSRQGINRSLSSPVVPSLRAVSFRTGRELWRFDVRQTRSYSRDNDSSPIDLGGGLLFNAGENAIGTFLNGSVAAATVRNGIKQPEIRAEVQLYHPSDAVRQGGNLVAEASPARWRDRVYVAAGAGRVYGIDILTKKIVWEFFIGSDLDGSIAVSQDDYLYCAVEKQYIPGSGGVYKLDPRKPPAEAVVWYLPVGNRPYSTWLGGVIGSVAINDEYRDPAEPALFATNAIDGHLYLGGQTTTTGKVNRGPRNAGVYHTPQLVAKIPVGPSISTPIFTDGRRLVSATYNGVHLFQLDWQETQPGDRAGIKNAAGDRFYRVTVKPLAHFKPGTSFEATPTVWDGRVYVASTNGSLYVLG